MKVGEVCLQTRDVRRLTAFYKQILGIDNRSCDEAHQILLIGDTVLSSIRIPKGRDPGLTLAIDVDDVDAVYRKAYALGAPILRPPTVSPRGVVTMSLLDSDDNQIYIRSCPDTI